MQISNPTLSTEIWPAPDRLAVMEQLVQNAAIGLYVLSVHGEEPCCDYVNGAWRRWSGIDRRDPKNWLSCFHPDDRVRMQQLYLKVFLTGRPDTAEYRICNPSEIVYLSDTVCPVLDDAGETIGVCGCAQDISLLKAAREDMERTQLLQSLGSLMAGIAHEINTPLQFIGDNLQFLSDAWQVLGVQLAAVLVGLKELRQAPDPARTEEFFRKLENARDASNSDYMEREFPKAVRQSLEGIERLMQIVAAMRDFSHLDERRQAPADLTKAIGSALTLLHNELKYTCDIETAFDLSLPEVNCSIDEINRVLLNLLINAAHSIGEKIEKGYFQRGKIRVSAERFQNGVRIGVGDNGMGIPPEVQDRIFERFFTTKRNHPSRRGTGQGLSMAYTAIVDHHRGSLTFESKPGEGTTFYIVLPLNQNAGNGV